MTDIEHDRAVVEAMRRERGRLTRRELSRKYCVSERVLTRLITQYELAFKRDPAIPAPLRQRQQTSLLTM